MYAIMKNDALANDNPTISFKKENYFNNQIKIIDGIPIDPILPKDFWGTPNEVEYIKFTIDSLGIKGI